jgi:hypothetical protein
MGVSPESKCERLVHARDLTDRVWYRDRFSGGSSRPPRPFPAGSECDNSAKGASRGRHLCCLLRILS